MIFKLKSIIESLPIRTKIILFLALFLVSISLIFSITKLNITSAVTYVVEESSTDGGTTTTGTTTTGTTSTTTGGTTTTGGGGSSSGGGGGGGGSGGSGGSGGGGAGVIVFKKVIVIQKITTGEVSTIPLDEPNIAFTKIRFNSLIDQINLLFIISNIQEKPDFLIETEGIAYQYLEIEIPLFTESKDFTETSINFKVDNDWIKENKIDKNTISLHRYKESTILETLPTTLTTEGDNYIHYTAISEGLSYFVITGDKRKTLIEKIFRENVEGVKKEDEQKQIITKPAEDKVEKEEKKDKVLIWSLLIGMIVVFLVGYFFIQKKIRQDKNKRVKNIK